MPIFVGLFNAQTILIILGTIGKYWSFILGPVNIYLIGGPIGWVDVLLLYKGYS